MSKCCILAFVEKEMVNFSLVNVRRGNRVFLCICSGYYRNYSIIHLLVLKFTATFIIIEGVHKSSPLEISSERELVQSVVC